MPRPAPEHKSVSGHFASESKLLPLVLVSVFLAPATVLWWLGWMRGRAACDQHEYHLPTIVKFAKELPWPDFHDYLSATTPGYHLLLAAIVWLVPTQTTLLQIVASVFTVGLLWLFGRAVWSMGRSRRPWVLTSLAASLAASPYVFTSGVWLVPDNAGWLLVLGTLLMCLKLGGSRAGLHATRWIAVGALLLLANVAVRQANLWLAAPFVVAAWFANLGRPRWRLAALACAACLPALLFLAYFARLWHGLTPPHFQAQHERGINWTTPAFFLALVGLFSPFYLAWIWPALASLWRTRRWVILVAALAGATLSILPETTFLREPRSSGLWNLVEVLEHHGLLVAGRTSPLIVVLAAIGGPCLLAWLSLAIGSARWVLAMAITSFVAAQSANANAWQRYHEPLLLMIFALVAAAIPAERSRVQRFAAVAGPLALSALLAALTVYGLMTGRDPTLANP